MGVEMGVGALLACDDRVCEDMIGAGGTTPTGWRGYVIGGLGGVVWAGCGWVLRTGR